MYNNLVFCRMKKVFEIPKGIPDISESENNGGGVVMYAIIETGGKQYKVEQGDVIYIEKLNNEAGSTIEFDRILAVAGDTMTVGNPIVSGAKVSGTILDHGKSKKVVVFKYKAKKNERKKQGHRQPYTKVKIEKISQRASSKKAATAEEAAE